MRKKNIFAWACDFSSFRGEGILARNFAKDLSNIKKVNIFVKTPDNTYLVSSGVIKKNKKYEKKIINFNLIENYYWPIIGILYLLIKYFKSKKILYLNFMPLWNFLLFYFLPPKTLIGPITGFLPKKKIENFSGLIRIILVPFFYRLSMLIIFIRFKILLFSTDLLKNLFLQKDHFKLNFNYLLFSSLKKKRKIVKNKKIDLLIYNRNYSVKEHFKLNNLIKYLLKKGYKVSCVGDRIVNIKGLKNYGIVSREKVKKLLKITNLIISSPENPYSLFTIDAINMGTKVLFDKKYKKKLLFLNYNSNNYINLDNQNFHNIEKIIKNKSDRINLNYRMLNSIKKRILNYFKKIII